MIRNFRLLYFLFVLILLVSCEEDYLAPKVVDINVPVSFSENIIPIMTSDCAIPTCHVTGGYAPDLSASKAYDELTGLGYVDTTNAEESLLYKRIIATIDPMPPASPLSAEEVGYILAWIKQGAQNN